MMILMILMMKRHLYKSCLNWLTSVRLIIVLRIITRILVRIILRICPVSRMRIRPVSGIWFRANNSYSSPTITTLSFLSILLWLIFKPTDTWTDFFFEWISNFTSMIRRDFIYTIWNISGLSSKALFSRKILSKQGIANCHANFFENVAFICTRTKSKLQQKKLVNFSFEFIRWLRDL